jgi:hypothetical protein
MKSRLTILAAVFLLAALVMPHTAEAQGFTVSRERGIDKVIESGNNQLLPKVSLTYDSADAATVQIERDTDRDLTITVGFGDLPIVHATAWYSASGEADAATALAAPVSGDFDDTATALQWKWSSGGKTIQIFITNDTTVADNSTITIADSRLDVSSLDDGDAVPISVSASDAADFVDFGTGGPGTVSSSIATAADGLTVKGNKAEGLSCGAVDGATVTVTEGFAGAWTNMNLARAANDSLTSDSLRLRIEVSGFPDVEGAEITWPDKVMHNANVAASGAEEDKKDIATLTLDKEDSLGNGRVAIYAYTNVDTAPDAADPTADPPVVAMPGIQPHLDDTARSFAVTIEGVKNLGSTELNVSAQLWPAARRNSDGKKNAADLRSILSFEHPLEDPEFDADKERDGAWLIVSDCITYLLYPFVTCQTGANPQWTTGISVSNTSRDAGIFGTFDLTDEQSGSVTFYGFPKSVATVSGSGQVPQHVVSMLTTNLAAGDTYTFSCHDSVMAGMEGYAIIKANFQHARGMGFVLTGDVAHGYMAEVIDDPADRSDALK